VLVATANILDRLDLGVAAEALASVLERGPDVVGLQEWGRTRRRILRAHDAYTWVAPGYGGNAVGFRRDRFALLGRGLCLVGSVGLADRGARPIRILPPRTTTLVRLLDRATGSVTSVIDYHLVPGVQSRGNYRADRPLLVRRHRSETRRLGALVTRQLAADGAVIALGDSNFDGFELPGLVSAWAGRRDDPAGTLGSGRKVDDVFGGIAATAVSLVRTASDHAAVVAERPD
jgi:endonuclease/exonuclease/phosphatase family metal-dependent hydrolase